MNDNGSTNRRNSSEQADDLSKFYAQKYVRSKSIVSNPYRPRHDHDQSRVKPPEGSPITAVKPDGRESWVRSVKRKATDETMEQRSQYLETIIRLEPQRSSPMSSTFDRLRFNNQHDGTNTKSINNLNDVPMNQGTITDQLELREFESSSGFLITDCDDAVTLSIPSPTRSNRISTINSNENQQYDHGPSHGLSTLMNEFELAHTQHRLEKKRRSKKKRKKQANEKLACDLTKTARLSSTSISETTTISNTFCGSTRSDSISINIDMDVINSKLTSNYSDREETVSRLLENINHKQRDLRRLKKCLLSLVKQSSIDSSNFITEKNIQIDQELFDAIFNPNLPVKQCWLCSGKMYTEAITQTTPIDKL